MNYEKLFKAFTIFFFTTFASFFLFSHLQVINLFVNIDLKSKRLPQRLIKQREKG